MSTLKSLAQMIVPPLPKTKNAWLAPYSDSGEFGQARAFQYFPEQLTDNRSVSVEEKYGIGSSHPIYQWIRGSAREITFDAVFTADAPLELKKDPATDTIDAIRGWVKNPAIAAATAIAGNKEKDPKYNQGVAAAVNWLRSFTYPYYTKTRAIAPRRCVLWFENSGLGSFVEGVGGGSIIPCIMVRCDVTYEAFFNNGEPRVATVSLQFVETIQVSNSWKYVGRDHFISAGSKYTGPVSSAKIKPLDLPQSMDIDFPGKKPAK